jgi:N-methylhydantoinase A/oxoprolinase/acetone carboxylase beta subunit
VILSTARVGIDVGGTFTDAVLVRDDGSFRIAKVRTSAGDASGGFLNALEQVAARGEMPLTSLSYLAHGTTVATNAIVQRRFDRTAFVTNSGFGDMLEIGTQRRRHLYDLWTPEPTPLVPRDRCFEITGRTGPQGEIIEPLDEASVREAASRMREMEIESVAVTLLFSFVNPEQEQRVAAILEEELPGVPVSLSCEIAPEFREYLRANTTALNASVLPLVGGYIGRLVDALGERQVPAPLHLMQSNGGVSTAEIAGRMPVALAASGPAAAVIGAARMGDAADERDLMIFDMGGTTADVSLVLDGQPQLRFLGDHGGHEVNFPQVDLLSVGAGGGSIASVDEFGSLSVGPQSAGSDPGPACYGNGGTRPTVTDAHAVLGVLSPETLLGGSLALDVEAARAVVTEHVSGPLGISVEEGAAAILRIANANMTNALRIVTVARGHDPREFALVPLGGAGPMHGCAIAEELGVTRIMLPRHPGVGAAYGLLLSDVRHDLRQGWLRATDEIDLDEFEEVIAGLRARAAELLAGTGGLDRAELVFEADLRYTGQAYSLTVPLPVGEDGSGEAMASAVTSFRDLHERLYDYSPAVTSTEIVTVRLSAVDPAGRTELAAAETSGDPMETGRRDVWIDGEWRDCRVLQRSAFAEGDRIEGPAVIEQEDATTVVYPEWHGTVVAGGNLLLRKENS